MRLVVVGNGMAGVICSKFLRDVGLQADIDIFAEEEHHYYPRPNLIEFLAGRLPHERLFAFQEDWYREKNINVHLACPVRNIHLDSCRLGFDEGKEETFDILLLANGSRPFIPPIKGSEKKRVFTLRTLEDCLQIIDCIKDYPKVTVLGGGLLGLEIARAVKIRRGDVQVVEFFPRLLPRQLDDEGASLLKSQIEDMGISVHLGMACQEILGSGEVTGLRFKDGQEFETETVIVAAGVRPETQLAAQAGLKTERGIVVDHHLQTSDSRVFALGDNIEHAGKTYGIIPATFEQAKVAAAVISGEQVDYTGTIPSNSLKVVGLDVTSIGLVNPEQKECREFRKMDEAAGVYKKIVFFEDTLVGVILMGTKNGVAEFNRMIKDKTEIGQEHERLLEDDFDFSIL
jgi:nitrite reductase (NADH) large subunit